MKKRFWKTNWLLAVIISWVFLFAATLRVLLSTLARQTNSADVQYSAQTNNLITKVFKNLANQRYKAKAIGTHQQRHFNVIITEVRAHAA